MIFISIVVLFLEPFVAMVGWNNLVHPIFNLPDLTYLQAFGLYTLLTLPTLSKTSFFLNTERGISFFIKLTNRDTTLADDPKSLIRDADTTYMKYKLVVLIMGLAFFHFVF